VAVGTTTRPTAGRPTATGMCPTTATTTSASGFLFRAHRNLARRGNVYGHCPRAQALTIAFIPRRGAPGRRETNRCGW